MNRITVLSIAGVLALSLAAYAGEDEPRVFRGEISDSQCAFNVHSLTQSHQEMLKSKSGDAGKTAASCTWAVNSCWRPRSTSIISITRICREALSVKR